ncbi:hypothetical protein FNL55_13675 [Tardiphaga sp. vice352]|uniref:DUF5413 family protein n=1 Tax=unclassified Tardiphaga TaxID=2631404 RepID=UPI001161EF32|nr:MULTISPECIES: DUF5413 family protein [unclassified Tardiphaga]QDM21895.1 hypothetical protein FIU28_12620 [Tardiphaga sp. vice154]QDM32274.1 hypothetical protein FNL55_13675 [Tardiphaga sp. vice352]
MKRILIFLLLGPALGYAIYLLWQLAVGRLIGGAEGVLLGLPFAYIFGVLPTLVIGFIDRFLSDRISLWPRVLISAAVGYVASVAMMSVWTAIPMPLAHLLTFGSVGAVQGAVCSWLSGDAEEADVNPAGRKA